MHYDIDSNAGIANQLISQLDKDVILADSTLKLIP